MTVLEASHSLLITTFLSGPINPSPTNPKLSPAVCHVVITTNIPANRTARRLEGNIRKYGGGGSVTT
jgi:hypothetical protein